MDSNNSFYFFQRRMMKKKRKNISVHCKNADFIQSWKTMENPPIDQYWMIKDFQFFESAFFDGDSAFFMWNSAFFF